MAVLVLAEHNNEELKSSTLSSINAAKQNVVAHKSTKRLMNLKYNLNPKRNKEAFLKIVTLAS